MAEGDLEGLDAWMLEAAESRLPSFESLTKGFRQDYQAIQLALTTLWSNAQCEGQICRARRDKTTLTRLATDQVGGVSYSVMDRLCTYLECH